jgi:hypothetical protein
MPNYEKSQATIAKLTPEQYRVTQRERNRVPGNRRASQQ